MLQRHDLLVGVFAVQFGFAERTAVRDCAREADAGGEPFGEFLERRGILDPAQRRMIEEMVLTALQANDGDAERTLDSLGGQRTVERCFGMDDPAQAATDATLVSSDAQRIPTEDPFPGDSGRVPTADPPGPGPAASPRLATGDFLMATMAPEADDRHASVYEEPAEVTPETDGRYVYLTRSGTMVAGSKTEAEIGRGGIGRVLVARDAHLGRDVAVKELLPTGGRGGTAATSGAYVDRFLREARVTGQLEHPSIISVHEVGRREDGTLYYTMKLVRGRTLARALEDCENLQARLRLLDHFVDLCQAMAYAHSRGVVHRDIKPANVMVGEFGETVVLDWGLAKVRGKRDIQGSELEKGLNDLRVGLATQTIAGDTLGTPAYMPPEQAEGRLEDIDEQSDVWSLGAVLFEMLTGRPPYEGNNPYEVLARVMQDDVPLATTVCAQASPELAAVAGKALTRDKAQRYPTALALAADIEAYLQGNRVSTYEYASWELLRRFAVKNKATLAVAGISLALLVAGGIEAYRAVVSERDKALVAEQEALHGKSRAQAAEKQADERASYARRMLARAFIEKARNAEAGHDKHAAQAYAAAALVQEPSFEARGLVVEMDSTRGVDLKWWSRAGAECLSLAHSPAGDRLACATRQGILVWDTATGQETARMVGMSWVASVAYSPRGDILASGGHDRTVGLWEAATGKRIEALRGHRDKVWSVAFSPDGATLASGGHDGAIHLWDVSTRKLKGKLAGHGDRVKVWSVAFSPDGARLASGGNDRLARVWRLDTGAEEVAFAGHEKAVLTVAFSPDGKTLATSSADYTARLWDIERKEARAVLAGHEKSVIPLAFTPDGATLVTGSADATVRLWDVATAKEVGRLPGHDGWVWALSLTADGRRLASAGRDITVRLWDLPRREEVGRLAGHGDDVTAVAFSPDGRRAASGGRDKTVRVWDVETGTEAARLSNHHDTVTSVAWSPDGRTLAVGSDDHFVRLWDLEARSEARRLEGHGAPVSCVAWSPDGARVASGAGDGSVRIWPTDPASGAVAMAEVCPSPVASVTWSPDGRSVVAACLDGVLRALVGPAARPGALRRFDRPVRAVEFSPDGRALAVAVEQELIVMSPDLQGAAREIASHGGALRGLAWSPDGRSIVAGGDDGTVRVCAAADGREESRMTTHPGGVSAVAWSPAGRALMSAGAGPTVCLWELASSGVSTASLDQGAAVEALAWTGSGHRLAAGDGDGSIRIWDPLTGRLVSHHRTGRGAVASVSASADGARLATAAADGVVQVVDTSSGKAFFQTEPGMGQVYGVGLSADGTTLAFSDGTVQVRRLRPGGGVDTLKGPWSAGDSPVRSLALSPDGKAVAAADWGTTVTLWDLPGLRKTAVLNAHPPFLSFLGFSDAGTEVVAGSTDGSLVVWDRGSGEVVGAFDGAGADVAAAAISPDGRTLVAVAKDGTLRIWDLPGRRELARFLGHAGTEVHALAFAPDGETVASGGADRTIRFWRLGSARTAENRLLDEALARAGRSLTGVELGPDPRWTATRIAMTDDRN